MNDHIENNVDNTTEMVAETANVPQPWGPEVPEVQIVQDAADIGQEPFKQEAEAELNS